MTEMEGREQCRRIVVFQQSADNARSQLKTKDMRVSNLGLNGAGKSSVSNCEVEARAETLFSPGSPSAHTFLERMKRGSKSGLPQYCMCAHIAPSEAGRSRRRLATQVPSDMDLDPRVTETVRVTGQVPIVPHPLSIKPWHQRRMRFYLLPESDAGHTTEGPLTLYDRDRSILCGRLKTKEAVVDMYSRGLVPQWCQDGLPQCLIDQLGTEVLLCEPEEVTWEEQRKQLKTALALFTWWSETDKLGNPYLWLFESFSLGLPLGMCIMDTKGDDLNDVDTSVLFEEYAKDHVLRIVLREFRGTSKTLIKRRCRERAIFSSLARAAEDYMTHGEDAVILRPIVQPVILAERAVDASLLTDLEDALKNLEAVRVSHGLGGGPVSDDEGEVAGGEAYEDYWQAIDQTGDAIEAVDDRLQNLVDGFYGLFEEGICEISTVIRPGDPILREFLIKFVPIVTLYNRLGLGKTNREGEVFPRYLLPAEGGVQQLFQVRSLARLMAQKYDEEQLILSKLRELEGELTSLEYIPAVRQLDTEGVSRVTEILTLDFEQLRGRLEGPELKAAVQELCDHVKELSREMAQKVARSCSSSKFAWSVVKLVLGEGSPAVTSYDHVRLLEGSDYPDDLIEQLRSKNLNEDLVKKGMVICRDPGTKQVMDRAHVHHLMFPSFFEASTLGKLDELDPTAILQCKDWGLGVSVTEGSEHEGPHGTTGPLLRLYNKIVRSIRESFSGTLETSTEDEMGGALQLAVIGMRSVCRTLLEVFVQQLMVASSWEGIWSLVELAGVEGPLPAIKDGLDKELKEHPVYKGLFKKERGGLKLRHKFQRVEERWREAEKAVVGSFCDIYRRRYEASCTQLLSACGRKAEEVKKTYVDGLRETRTKLRMAEDLPAYLVKYTALASQHYIWRQASQGAAHGVEEPSSSTSGSLDRDWAFSGVLSPLIAKAQAQDLPWILREMRMLIDSGAGDILKRKAEHYPGSSYQHVLDVEKNRNFSGLGDVQERQVNHPSGGTCVIPGRALVVFWLVLLAEVERVFMAGPGERGPSLTELSRVDHHTPAAPQEDPEFDSGWLIEVLPGPKRKGSTVVYAYCLEREQGARPRAYTHCALPCVNGPLLFLGKEAALAYKDGSFLAMDEPTALVRIRKQFFRHRASHNPPLPPYPEVMNGNVARAYYSGQLPPDFLKRMTKGKYYDDIPLTTLLGPEASAQISLSDTTGSSATHFDPGSSDQGEATGSGVPEVLAGGQSGGRKRRRPPQSVAPGPSKKTMRPGPAGIVDLLQRRGAPPADVPVQVVVLKHHDEPLTVQFSSTGTITWMRDGEDHVIYESVSGFVKGVAHVLYGSMRHSFAGWTDMQYEGVLLDEFRRRPLMRSGNV